MTKPARRAAASGRPRTPAPDDLGAAIARARDYLLERQHPEGCWQGYLENDAGCTGQYLLLSRYVNLIDPGRRDKAVRYLQRTRSDEGGWVQVPGGPSNLDATLINYVALALSGVPETTPEMAKSRRLVKELGGPGEANFITRILLAFFGVFPLESLPWAATSLIENQGLIYRQGFPRTILIPYLVLYELKAVQDCSSLLPLALALWEKPGKGMKEELLQAFLRGFALLHDPLTAILHQEKCLGWIAERQEADGTWAGVLQVTLFSMMALHADGDERWQEAIRQGMEGVISYQIETPDEVVQQFSVSPVMDTAYAVTALCRAGVASDARSLRSAVSWLMGRQSRREGDWKHNNPEGEPGGWGFETHNSWYPDLDCTSMVLNAMTYLQEEERRPYYGQMDRGVQWMVSMQNWDGGFAVWDKNNWLLFRTLNIVLEVGDYSHADITARVVKSLANLRKLPRYRDRPEIRKALRAATRFLWAQQEGLQRWHGRWNVNYTYGTGQVLEALANSGIRASHLFIRPAVAWLARVQNPDGGWGESVASYEKHRFVPDASTAMQTACVLQGLVSIGAHRDEAVRLGFSWLLSAQDPDGHWEDRAFTAVNIPRVWYGRYELIPTLFALIALCEYRDRFPGES